jgi:hypothetical protein
MLTPTTIPGLAVDRSLARVHDAMETIRAAAAVPPFPVEAEDAAFVQRVAAAAAGRLRPKACA